MANRQATEDKSADRGHPDVRPPHGSVLQYLDQAGTRVSELAARAQVTKQSMAELLLHLERHGYVERVPDPSDRRAKTLHLTPADGRGITETRAGLGGTYAALGGWALVSSEPAADVAVGMTWLGAAAVRVATPSTEASSKGISSAVPSRVSMLSSPRLGASRSTMANISGAKS